MKHILLALFMCAMILPGCKKSETEKPFTGNFYSGQYGVTLSSGDKNAVFTAVGVGQRSIGEEFIKDAERTGDNTWHATVYNETFITMQEGDVTIEGNLLNITPKGGLKYTLFEGSPIISGGSGGSGGNGGGGSGNGCSPVQCSGTTQAGARCKRTTTNCSGRCWQH